MELYHGVVKFIPLNASEIWLRAMQLSIFFDASHSKNVFIQILYSGFVVFIGILPMIFRSKLQNIVESEDFGSSFLVLKFGTESNRPLHYNMRMLG